MEKHQQKEKIIKDLIALADVFNEELTEMQMEVYAENLSDLEFPILREVLFRVGLRKWKFFPRVAEIFEIYESLVGKEFLENQEADEQWLLVQKEACQGFRNSELSSKSLEIIRRLGGKNKFAYATDKDMTFLEHKFKNLFAESSVFENNVKTFPCVKQTQIEQQLLKTMAL